MRITAPQQRAATWPSAHPLNDPRLPSRRAVIRPSRIVSYRKRVAELSDFEMRVLDNLTDYAMAAWYVHLSNLPGTEASELSRLTDEVVALRSKFMMWAVPLVQADLFDAAAIEKINQGAGYKDTAGDVAALAGLYRSHWDRVKDNCAVTEEDITRASVAALAMFTAISQRDLNPWAPAPCNAAGPNTSSFVSS